MTYCKLKFPGTLTQVCTHAMCVYVSMCIICECVCAGSGDKYLEDDYVFRVKNSSGQVCLTASFKLSFDLYYENVTYNESQTIVNVTVRNETLYASNNQ